MITLPETLCSPPCIKKIQTIDLCQIRRAAHCNCRCSRASQFTLNSKLLFSDHSCMYSVSKIHHNWSQWADILTLMGVELLRQCKKQPVAAIKLMSWNEIILISRINGSSGEPSNSSQTVKQIHPCITILFTLFCIHLMPGIQPLHTCRRIQ